MVDWADRIITATPVDYLWDRSGPISARFEGPVGRGEIAGLVRRGVRIVLLLAGYPPSWFSAGRPAAEVWTSILSSRLAEGDGNIFPEHHPDAYCFTAAIWRTPDGEPILAFVQHD